jgi:hypothetical protein
MFGWWRTGRLFRVPAAKLVKHRNTGAVCALCVLIEHTRKDVELRGNPVAHNGQQSACAPLLPNDNGTQSVVIR